jgi:PKD repeat protein
MMQKNLRLPFLILLLLCFANWSCKKNDPISNFSFSAAYTYAPVKIKFQNLSSDATEYSWSFGDGNSSIDENPENEFTAGGQYTVTLVAKNSKKKSSLMSKEFVVLPTPRYCLVESVLLENVSSFNSNVLHVVSLNQIKSIERRLEGGATLFAFTTPVQMDINDIQRKIEISEYVVNNVPPQPPQILITPKDSRNFNVLNDLAKTGTEERYPSKIKLTTSQGVSFAVNLKWF